MRDVLEHLYDTLNHREYIRPDPLELVYEYDAPADREIVALVASTLAYGRVAQILTSARAVLSRLGENPAGFVAGESPGSILRAVAGIRHRFTDEQEIANLLIGAGQVIRRRGSLEACFVRHMDADGITASAIGPFVAEIADSAGMRPASLLPLPERGSACKRLHLFLRWMVREDDVDPGVWKGVDPVSLIVPLDVHMHRMARKLGLTARSQADLRTALEITGAFREFAPLDPVKYDFALTRIGIRQDCSEVLDACFAHA